MKSAFFAIFLVFSCFLVSGQSFEGEIIYHNTYKSKQPAVSNDQLNGALGATENYYIKGGNYKAEVNGALMQWQLYVNSDNKLYSKLATSPIILWNDGATNDDEVLSTELHKDAVDILGYKCDELVLKCKSGIQKYYFSTKLPVDSKLFSRHQYGNWYAYLSKANAIPLKMVIENERFNMESIATELKPMTLDNIMFILPQGVQLMKNPY
jgi:hypothetical protein